VIASRTIGAICTPHISITPDFATVVTSLFSSRTPDDPIWFSIKEPPFDRFGGSFHIDKGNSEATEIDKLWDCTMYHSYDGSVKLRVEEQKRDNTCNIFLERK
jgi:hypothetical protein